jgi:hypothetical protein
MSAPWYRSLTHVPLHVQVRVQAAGREFIAMRFRDPKSEKIHWVECKNDRPKPLPRWLEVEIWQPLFPDKWKMPLPEPITESKAGIMVSERTLLQALADAEAADLAREMEEDREAARAGTAPNGEAPDARQWWRDATLIKYEECGSVTLQMCEGRVMRALCYDRLIKMDLKPDRTNAAVLADLKGHTEPQDVDPTHDWRPPFEPGPRDFKDYLVAMSWVNEAVPSWPWSREQKIFYGRALDPPLSWSDLASQVHTSRETARTLHKSALARMCAAANAPTLRAYAQVIQLRARNVATKRA